MYRRANFGIVVRRTIWVGMCDRRKDVGGCNLKSTTVILFGLCSGLRLAANWKRSATFPTRFIRSMRRLFVVHRMHAHHFLCAHCKGQKKQYRLGYFLPKKSHSRHPLTLQHENRPANANQKDGTHRQYQHGDLMAAIA